MATEACPNCTKSTALVGNYSASCPICHHRWIPSGSNRGLTPGRIRQLLHQARELTFSTSREEDALRELLTPEEREEARALVLALPSGYTTLTEALYRRLGIRTRLPLHPVEHREGHPFFGKRQFDYCVRPSFFRRGRHQSTYVKNEGEARALLASWNRNPAGGRYEAVHVAPVGRLPEQMQDMVKSKRRGQEKKKERLARATVARPDPDARVKGRWMLMNRPDRGYNEQGISYPSLAAIADAWAVRFGQRGKDQYSEYVEVVPVGR